MPAIEIKNLKKSYGEIKAVDGIDLLVEENEVFGILGPNGAGKTTTLEMIETLRRPDSGNISVLGLNPVKKPSEVKEILGVQLQTTVFFDDLSVKETVNLFRSFYKKSLETQGLLELVDLRDKSEAKVTDLSGGQHKRLSIALAVVNDPEIIFLDEPTTGLDPQARRMIWEIISRFRDQGKTVVVTTHYIEEAEYLCDRVAVMDLGKIIVTGSPEELIDRYAPENIITFKLEHDLDIDLISSLAGVTEARVHNSAYTVYTSSPEKTMLSILQTAENRHLAVFEINLKKATLEDVFLKITGKSIRQ
ncbi:MAG: ABC transporter ATP-binding protein [Actinobacteria bacterium]|nr:ABC transporter ATP-binding protein [Actinomycetota bacterium]